MGLGLPQILAQKPEMKGIPQVGLPRATADSYGASAWGAAAETANEFAKAYTIVDARETKAAAEEALTGMQVRLNERYAQIKTEGDHTNIRSLLEESIKNEKSQVYQQTRTMPRQMQSAVRLEMQKAVGGFRVRAIEHETTSLANYAALEARATSREERELWRKGQGRARIGERLDYQRV